MHADSQAYVPGIQSGQCETAPKEDPARSRARGKSGGLSTSGRLRRTSSIREANSWGSLLQPDGSTRSATASLIMRCWNSACSKNADRKVRGGVEIRASTPDHGRGLAGCLKSGEELPSPRPRSLDGVHMRVLGTMVRRAQMTGRRRPKSDHAMVAPKSKTIRCKNTNPSSERNAKEKV